MKKIVNAAIYFIMIMMAGYSNLPANEINQDELKNALSQQPIFFAHERSEIRQDMLEILKKTAYAINKIDNSKNIMIVGNCDRSGSEDYNYELGLKRAMNVKKSLVNNGVDPKRLTIISYGESTPICKESIRSCSEKNRRVSFKIIE